MDTSLDATHTPARIRWPSLRAIAVAALVANALLWAFAVIPSAPPEHYVPKVVISLVVAGIVALRYRWTPVFGALWCAGQLAEGFIFLRTILTAVDSATNFTLVALFFAIPVVGLVASIGAIVLNYRAPRSHPLVELPAPPWTYPVVLTLTVLVLGSILWTAIQARGDVPSMSAEALAALPALTTRDYQFAPSEIRAKVGETVVLRLDNADTSTHYLDSDEFNVHVLMPPGKSTVAIFTPTQPGTYTFYCHPHADKAARTGMVGTLVVEP
jgi:plastocyanin